MIQESHLSFDSLGILFSHCGCFLNVIILSHIFDNCDLNFSSSSTERAPELSIWPSGLTLSMGKLGPGLWWMEGLPSDVVVPILELI